MVIKIFLGPGYEEANIFCILQNIFSKIDKQSRHKHKWRIDLMRELRDVLYQVILTLFYTSAAPSARG